MAAGTVADLSTQARKADGAIEFRMAGGDCGIGAGAQASGGQAGRGVVVETGSVLGI
jgi:hypothetical protein